MTRWVWVYRRLLAIRRIAQIIPFSGVRVSPDVKEFIWLDISKILAIQTKYKDKVPKGCSEGLVKFVAY